MSNNIIAEKTLDFAVRIVNLQKHLVAEKRNSSFLGKFSVAEQVLAPMWPRLSGDKAHPILRQKCALL